MAFSIVIGVEKVGVAALVGSWSWLLFVFQFLGYGDWRWEARIAFDSWRAGGEGVAEGKLSCRGKVGNAG